MTTNAMLLAVQQRQAAREERRDAREEERAAERRQRLSRADQIMGRTRTPSQPATGTPTATTLPAPAPTNALTPQQQAFNAFYGTPLYQVPLQQGLQALNANYAARGMLESGAAMKGISDYGAGMAAGGLRDYMSMLGNQQAIGFNAASAQAGANQNYANSISGSNANYANALSGMNSQFANNATGLTSGYANAASQGAGQLGNAIGQGAINTGNILGNQAMLNAQNTNSMIGGIGNALGGLAGFAAYRPYGG